MELPAQKICRFPDCSLVTVSVLWFDRRFDQYLVSWTSNQVVRQLWVSAQWLS